MRTGLIGLSSSGKTTLMGAFTGKKGDGKKDMGIVTVPDQRIQELSKMYSPKKTTPANIMVEDLPPVDTQIKEEKIKFSDKTKKLDVQIVCIGGYRCFTTEDIIKEIEKVRFEIIIGDLDIATKRVEKIEQELKRAPKQKMEKEAEINLLNKVKIPLEEEKFPIIEDENEVKLLRNYNLLTVKPTIYAINLSQEQYVNNSQDIEEKIKNYLQEKGDTAPVLLIDAMTEADIMDMDEGEMEEFLKAFGMTEPAKNKLIRQVYKLLGLITFFTVGEDEVRAWNVYTGDTAVDAAGAIHTDLARGFIRAEVVEAEILLNLGSMNAAKSQGKLRLEGKTYKVKDGDIVHILFNI